MARFSSLSQGRRFARWACRFSLACVLCLAMMSLICSCSKKADDVSASTYVGAWTLYSYQTSESAGVGPETVQQLRNIGYSLNVTINEDKTCVLDNFGVMCDGTWDFTKDGISLTFEELELTVANSEIPQDSGAAACLSMNYDGFVLWLVPVVAKQDVSADNPQE